MPPGVAISRPATGEPLKPGLRFPHEHEMVLAPLLLKALPHKSDNKLRQQGPPALRIEVSAFGEGLGIDRLPTRRHDVSEDDHHPRCQPQRPVALRQQAPGPLLRERAEEVVGDDVRGVSFEPEPEPRGRRERRPGRRSRQPSFWTPAETDRSS